MATCYGRYIHEAIDIRKKAPFRAFISASKAIYPKEILESYGKIFQLVIESGDLIKAYLSVLKSENIFFYKDVREMWKDCFALTFAQISNDPERRKEFIDNVKKDYANHSENSGWPALKESDINFMMGLVKQALIAQTTNNFFFGVEAK